MLTHIDSGNNSHKVRRLAPAMVGNYGSWSVVNMNGINTNDLLSQFGLSNQKPEYLTKIKVKAAYQRKVQKAYRKPANIEGANRALIEQNIFVNSTILQEIIPEAKSAKGPLKEVVSANYRKQVQKAYTNSASIEDANRKLQEQNIFVNKTRLLEYIQHLSSPHKRISYSFQSVI